MNHSILLKTAIFVSLLFTSLYSGVEDVACFYRERYGICDVQSKLVGNRGNGFDLLYGVRNFRVVLHGILYRGGANNYYHNTSPRDNRNPLPDDGLLNLCEEGFKGAIYLYRRNFDTAPSDTACISLSGTERSLRYHNILPFTEGNIERILAMVYENINSKSPQPIYAHCWNGWHASGYVAALALKQFCDLGDEEAVSYWNAATDGTAGSEYYDKIRKKIRSFRKLPSLRISEDKKEIICPRITFSDLEFVPF